MPQDSEDNGAGRALDADAPAGTVTIHGPLWTAEAEVLRLAEPQAHAALRALLVGPPVDDDGRDPSLLLPGTVLALCWVRSVTVNPTDADEPVYVWARPD